jgi:protein NRD1
LQIKFRVSSADTAPHSQTSPNTASSQPSQPQLDPGQFALLQQLAQTAKLGNGQPIPSPVQTLAPSVRPGPPGGFGGPSHPHPPYRDDHHSSGRGDPRYGRYDNQGRGRGRGDHYEDRSSYRGSYRGGGGFRGRGRGGYDDRDHFREKEGYRSPPPRPRRSRSRSPPSRYGGGVRRDVKPYSPPQRPTMAPLPDRQASSHSADSVPISSAATGGQRDEFGRDIRPQSPEEAEELAQPLNVPASIEQGKAAPAIAGNQISSVPQQTPSVVAANTSTQIHSPPAAVTSQPGLDKFDMSTFDFTASSSWEALGKMWQVTYGYLPSQEELMQFVMSGGIIASAAAAGMIPGQYQGMMGIGEGWSQSGAGQWAGAAGVVAGGYPNQGDGPGYGSGNARNNQQQRGGYKAMGYQQNSDAIVLGGGDVSSEGEAMQVESPPPVDQASPLSGEGGLGGRMQRVGDKWVFVRDTITS